MATITYHPGFYHREVSFCKVFGMQSKSIVESVLLKNGISYFIEMQKRPFLSRTFIAKNKADRSIFIFKINEADVEKAGALIKSLDPSQVTPIVKE